MFRLTPQAATQIRHAALAADSADMALRVAAKRGADGEVEYAMGFDDERNNDTALSVEGLRIVISPHSTALLSEIELDYVELEPGAFNFIFVTAGAAPVPGPAGGCGSACGGGCSGRSGVKGS
ncbi:MAG: iron-sulfur cluster assembly accessory protein [Betaproteobacteria bacterium]